jgi:glycosyltransferase involved in cell wall biosynthesis
MPPINPRKFLFLASWYPESAASRNGLFIWSHAEALAENPDCQVDLLAVLSSHQTVYTLSTCSHKGVNHWVMRYPDDGNKMVQAWRFWRAWSKLYSAYKKENGQPQWVIVNVLWRAGLWAWWLKMRFNLPYIIIEHWSAYLIESKRIIGFVEKYLSKLIADEAEAILPVSEALEIGMRTRFLGRKFQLLPNIIDTRIFQPPADRVQHKAPVLMHVSNLAQVKNFDFVVSVFKALKVIYPQARLWVAGAYDEANKSRYEAETAIEWLGLLEKETLAQYYQQADFLLLPSFYETFSIVLGEALACGCSVLTTPLPGLSQYDALPNRFSHPLELNLWVACIEKNWQHKQANAWKNIDNAYSSANVSKKLLSIISKLKA